jgi:hypothetical protein
MSFPDRNIASFRVMRDESLDELDVADQTNTSTIRSKIALGIRTPTDLPAGGGTASLTAAAIVNGLVTCSTAGAVACTIATAASIIAALKPFGFGRAPGDSYAFTLTTYGGASTLTVVTNTGVTLLGIAGDVIVTGRTTRLITILYTSPTTVSVY